MYKILFKKIGSDFLVVTALVAAFASTVAFLFQISSIEHTSIIIGIAGSIVGALLVYFFSRVRIFSDAPSVFISYADKDSAFAHQVAEQLGKFPVRVLIDVREFTVGDNISEKFGYLVDNCDYFAFVLSENYLQSDWAISELTQAIKKKKRVLPLLKDAVELPVLIKDIVYADFTQSFEAGMVKLCHSLRDKRYYKADQMGTTKKRRNYSKRYNYKAK